MVNSRVAKVEHVLGEGTRTGRFIDYRLRYARNNLARHRDGRQATRDGIQGSHAFRIEFQHDYACHRLSIAVVDSTDRDDVRSAVDLALQRGLTACSRLI